MTHAINDVGLTRTFDETFDCLHLLWWHLHVMFADDCQDWYRDLLEDGHRVVVDELAKPAGIQLPSLDANAVRRSCADTRELFSLALERIQMNQSEDCLG